MPPQVRNEGFVYRKGSRSETNFTPRSEKDLDAKPGTAPGISVWSRLEHGTKGQKIDLSRLALPLRAFEDDLAEGGVAGHFTIAPVTDEGTIDHEKLKEWAGTRAGGGEHALTRLLLAAIVEANCKGPS